MQTPTQRGVWHDAYDVQMALWRWTRPGMPGEEWLKEHLNETAAALRYETKTMIGSLYMTENIKLLTADPIYVSEEMCEVVAAAAPSLDPEPLLPTDLLTTCGFVLFAKPFGVMDRFDTETTIAAFSWLPMTADQDAMTIGPDHLLEKWAERDFIGEWEKLDKGAPGALSTIEGIGVTLYAIVKESAEWLQLAQAPRMVPFHITPWWFGMSYEGNEFDENGKPTGAAWWWKIIQTTLRLMQQQIASRRKERPDRHARREGARRGFDDREIVVVRLRREKGAPHSDESLGGEANYSHRFIVSGHWRNQWYPSAHIHRQIWISPYVKGPEDQPLVVRPRRVFTWSR